MFNKADSDTQSKIDRILLGESDLRKDTIKSLLELDLENVLLIKQLIDKLK